MKKVIGDPDICWLCGANGRSDPLDRHHAFGGANRKLSEEDGLCFSLCHNKCHIFGSNSVHQNRAQDLRLKQQAQRYAMIKHDYTIQQFIARYGKNYLDESGLDIWPEENDIC